MMVNQLLLCCLLGVTLVNGRDVIAPVHTIDLNLPPEQRWADIAANYSAIFPQLIKELEQILPNSIVEVVTSITGEVSTYFPEPYAQEIIGVAKHANITVGEVALANIFYDISAFWKGKGKGSKACTSIVAEDTNGQIFHGRNLDYSLFSSVLEQLTITVHFVKDNTVVYTGTTYAGYVGLLTGQKPNRFTISLDERDKGWLLQNFLEALKSGTHGITSFAIRDTLAEETADFDWAVKHLSTVPLIAPSYIIVGGVGRSQGAVITRDRASAKDVWKLDAQNGRWYILETNYDHWKAPPSDDDRRDPAIRFMNGTGQANINGLSMFNVLSTAPVLNERTTYTVVMAASSPDLYFSVIRYNK